MRVFLFMLSMFLQEATNRLFLRRFTINVGLLKDNRAPAVVLSRKQFFGKSQVLLVDIHSFLDIAKAVADTEPNVLEKQGYVINKSHKMSESFLIPSWAFPKAMVDVLNIAEGLVSAMKAMKASMDRLTEVMEAAGIAKEEIEKFKSTVTGSKPTIH